MSHMGPRAFNHNQSQDTEAEYDRLRDLARQEASKRNSCFQRSQEAYTSGDGAKAKELSEQGKAHGRKMEEYNKQASEFIFRENNAEEHVAPDTIDLHGQFVEEAEEILEERIRYAKNHGQTHLHVIVGKGNHSANHVQKIKPRVEQVCRELGLQYATEENAGRIYVNLTGGPADMSEAPPMHHPSGGYAQQQPHHQYPGQQSHQYQQQQPHHQQQQYPQHQQQQQEGNQNEIEQVVNAVLPRVLRKLEKACCVVM
ncbi:Smr domain-containing protein [Aspergillus homomorphus CBS 101889]|uniref:Smr family protein n=1 Tax=Aspergillus homomorphus (strain CBS 101889) TaxID=1450537 RepID=A0A395HGY3_ASPHC|nr:smr family protein [Aspergillus homomorphus CBS 101889]RAL07172.1 smr family protein [Aspergillus homomorphus CBS 101889]